MGYKAKQRCTSFIIHAILIIGSIGMLLPFAWMVLTAVKTRSQAISVNPFYFSQLTAGILKILQQFGNHITF